MSQRGVELPPTWTSSVSAVVPADPDAVFATLTDLARLPEWNDRMTKVVECPERVEVGAEWVVEFEVFGRKWRSRSRVDGIDAAARSFAHRTETDDGNPSFADWRWEVEKAEDGARVTVMWDLHPVTFWRRVLFGRIRARQLTRTEVPNSLRALGRAAQVRATAG